MTYRSPTPHKPALRRVPWAAVIEQGWKLPAVEGVNSLESIATVEVMLVALIAVVLIVLLLFKP